MLPGAAVTGVDFTTSTVAGNVMYKDPTIEPALYSHLFYSFNAATGSPDNSGYGRAVHCVMTSCRHSHLLG